MLETNLPNENYLKSMKNGITIISCVSFIINTIASESINDILLIALTYFSSAALSFYALTPVAEEAKKRKNIVVNLSIYAVVLLMVCTLISNKFTMIELFMLYLIKVIYILGSIIIPCFSFIDDSNHDTVEEKNVRARVKKDLVEFEENKTYKVRETKKTNNSKIREFLKIKKPKREDNKK